MIAEFGVSQSQLQFSGYYVITRDLVMLTCLRHERTRILNVRYHSTARRLLPGLFFFYTRELTHPSLENLIIRDTSCDISFEHTKEPIDGQQRLSYLGGAR